MHNSAAPRVAVVVPTFRRPTQLAALVESLCNGSQIPDRIIIVDNDPERSCPRIERDETRIDVVYHGAGLNLPGARNAGWRAARDVDIVCFLDDDNTVAADAVKLLTGELTDPDVGMAAPVIYCTEPEDIVWCGGISRSMWTTRTTLEHRGSRDLPPLRTWATEGAPDALAVRVDVLEALDGFDDVNFPFGHDESDLDLRIAAFGLSRVMVRDAKVWHEGATPGIWGEYTRAAGLHGEERVRLNWRGRVIFHRRYSNSFLQQVVSCYLFLPLGGVVATIITASAPGTYQERVGSSIAIWRGIVNGYRWRWRLRGQVSASHTESDPTS